MSLPLLLGEGWGEGLAAAQPISFIFYAELIHGSKKDSSFLFLRSYALIPALSQRERELPIKLLSAVKF